MGSLAYVVSSSAKYHRKRYEYRFGRNRTGNGVVDKGTLYRQNPPCFQIPAGNNADLRIFRVRPSRQTTEQQLREITNAGTLLKVTVSRKHGVCIKCRRHRQQFASPGQTQGGDTLVVLKLDRLGRDLV